MKQYIKLFEDFNPEEFLEDFDIITFTPSGFRKAILNKSTWKVPEIKDIILSGLDSKTYSFTESDDFINQPGSITIRARSRYDLMKQSSEDNIKASDAASRLGYAGSSDDSKYINYFIKTHPKESFLTLAWFFKFTEKTKTDGKRINVEIGFDATNSILYNFNHNEQDLEEFFVEETMSDTIVNAINHGLDLIQYCNVARGINGAGKTNYLNRIFSAYCKLFYEHPNHAPEDL